MRAVGVRASAGQRSYLQHAILRRVAQELHINDNTLGIDQADVPMLWAI